MIATISLALSLVCALIIVIDEIRRPQHMWITNLVWPITALYFSIFGLWDYFRSSDWICPLVLGFGSRVGILQATLLALGNCPLSAEAARTETTGH